MLGAIIKPKVIGNHYIYIYINFFFFLFLSVREDLKKNKIFPLVTFQISLVGRWKNSKWIEAHFKRKLRELPWMFLGSQASQKSKKVSTSAFKLFWLSSFFFFFNPASLEYTAPMNLSQVPIIIKMTVSRRICIPINEWNGPNSVVLP